MVLLSLLGKDTLPPALAQHCVLIYQLLYFFLFYQTLSLWSFHPLVPAPIVIHSTIVPILSASFFSHGRSFYRLSIFLLYNQYCFAVFRVLQCFVPFHFHFLSLPPFTFSLITCWFISFGFGCFIFGVMTMQIILPYLCLILRTLCITAPDTAARASPRHFKFSLSRKYS